MATSTTITAVDDSTLNEAAPTNNYATDNTFKTGQVSSVANRSNGVIQFDVSTFTKPSDIVSAELTLYADNGASNRFITVARLERNYVEAQVTWNNATTADAWTTAGGDADFINNTVAIEVGFRVGDQSVDITPLVVDAITRRSGTLWLLVGISPADTDTSTLGWTTFYSSESISPPKIEMTVASRIVWDGDPYGDGNAQTASNWVGDVLPTINDFVLFNDGAVDVTNGAIVCHSMFIGEGYTGNIIQSDGSSILIASSATAINTTANINKRRGKFKFDDAVDVSRNVYIANTPNEECIFETVGTGGSVFVEKTSGELEVIDDSNLVTTGKTHKRVKLTGTQTDVVCGSNTKLILENGCKKLNLFNSKCTCSGGIAFNSANSTISGGGVFNLQNDETANTVNVYNGTITFQNNENAVIETKEIVLWKRGILNTSVGIKSWQPTSTPALDMKGGNFIVDAGTNITIGN